MAELKTRANDRSVEEFLEAIPDPGRREDCRALSQLMQEVTGAEPRMWGDSIVGFGIYHYKYASGREGDWPLTGFSPRKRNLTIYLTSGFDGYGALLEKLGKHKTGVGCLYINRLADVDRQGLRELVSRSVAQMRAAYPA